MDILSCISCLLLFLALFASRSLIVTRKRGKGEKKIRAPEPPGAWPFIGHLHLLGAQVPIVRILGAMADKHGPIFSLRLGNRQAVVVSSWEMVKECFTTNDRNFASRPVMAVAKYIGYDHALFSLAPYGPYWREMRKMVTLELLTNQRLEKLKHVRQSELDNLIKNFYLLITSSSSSSKDNSTKLINLNNWIEYLTFNMILRTLAGKRFSSCSDGDGKKDDDQEDEDWMIKEAIKKTLYLSGVFVVSDVIPSLEWMDIGGHIKAMKQAGKELDGVLQPWLEEHIQRRKESQVEDDADFMDVMLSAFPENSVNFAGHKRDDIIKSTTANLILTASESTAETLIWAVSLLLNNREILKLAQEELDAQVGKTRWVQESDIGNLKYLQAIVKETLRLYPPGPLSGPREASEDCYIGEYFVPKGTRLIVNLWKLHRDPRVWKDPLQYKPERFMDSHNNVNYKGQSYEYIPFSSGRRMCPAVNYGLLVVHLTLARLIQSYELATPMNVAVDMSEGLGIALPKVKPLEVILTPRLPLELYQKL